MAPTTANPWVVFDYELDMFRAMCGLLNTGNTDYTQLRHHVRNAVVESAVLHSRILADIILSRCKMPDDIGLDALLPGFTPRSLGALQAAYGNSTTAGCPCQTFNKMLAHPTMLRSDSHDYSPVLNKVGPLIDAIVQEVQAERTARGIT